MLKVTVAIPEASGVTEIMYTERSGGVAGRGIEVGVGVGVGRGVGVGVGVGIGVGVGMPAAALMVIEALPCACVPVALGKKMTESGTDADGVPERNPIKESELSEETVYAAPQGISLTTPAGLKVRNWSPFTHW